MVHHLSTVEHSSMRGRMRGSMSGVCHHDSQGSEMDRSGQSPEGTDSLTSRSTMLGTPTWVKRKWEVLSLTKPERRLCATELKDDSAESMRQVQDNSGFADVGESWHQAHHWGGYCLLPLLPVLPVMSRIKTPRTVILRRPGKYVLFVTTDAVEAFLGCAFIAWFVGNRKQQEFR